MVLKSKIKPGCEAKLCKRCCANRAAIKNRTLSKEKSHQWKGGRRLDTMGYVKVHFPGHAFADSTNYVREHLLVAADAYGEDFVRENGGAVHHIDGNKTNNSLENLFVTTRKRNADYNSDLLRIAFSLVQAGVIEFRDGKYLCPLLGDEKGEAA